MHKFILYWKSGELFLLYLYKEASINSHSFNHQFILIDSPSNLKNGWNKLWPEANDGEHKETVNINVCEIV